MEWLLLIILFIVLVLIAISVNRKVIEKYGSHQTAKKGNIRIKDLNKNPRSKSEAEVISYLEVLTGKKFPTVYPKWLKWKGHTLELDGYNEALNIALEFSGPLHTKWYPDKETYQDYFERLVRDIVKQRLCKRFGVNLIVVDVSLPSRHWRNYVISRLFDFSVIEDKPAEYIPIQHAKPFRNKQLEREYGIGMEMKMAKNL